MTEAREPKFWTCDDSAELLTATTIADAVCEWADDRDGPLPDEVTVYGFVPMELPSAERLAENILDDVVQWLDGDYGDQTGGDTTEITPALKDAALAFAEVVRREYDVWACKQVTEQVVKVADYYTENA